MISIAEFDKIFEDVAHFPCIAVDDDYDISDDGRTCVNKYIYDTRNNQCWHLIAIFEYPKDCISRTNFELTNKVVDVVERYFNMKLEDMLYMDKMDKMNKFELATTRTWSFTKDDIDKLKQLTNSHFGIEHKEYSWRDLLDAGYFRSFDIPKWRSYVYKIDRVIFNDPATIILWKSGEKTVVKCGPNEEFDKEKGLAMALCKYILGNKGNFNEFFKKFMEEEK